MKQLHVQFLFLMVLIIPSANICFSQNTQYGANEANKRFSPLNSLLGGQTDFDYLNLKNHPSASGVPLGGIGVGNVEFAPDGRFVRIGMNNIHIPEEKTDACFFALWQKTRRQTSVTRLVRDEQIQCGMQGLHTTYYKGLFPQVDLSFDKKELQNVQLSIHAYSGLIPHNIKNSSLPVVFFDLMLQANEAVDISVAFAWEDLIGRGIKDPASSKGMDGQIFSATQRQKIVNGEQCPYLKPVTSFAQAFQCNNYYGVKQFIEKPIQPTRATFQNYVDEVAIIAEQQKGDFITVLPHYAIHDEAAWKSFIDKGIFVASNVGKQPLSANGIYDGSVVAVKTKLNKGQTKHIRFMLVWFFPELKIDSQTMSPDYYWRGGSDYGRYFHNYFHSIKELIYYAAAQKETIYRGIEEWQAPILTSTLPDWYKFKLINSAYVIYTNMVLNKKGDVTINEGGMGGLAGTMDQRICSHPFYQKFFTQLDRSEMNIFAYGQAADGSIPHFIGHYYFGMGTVGGRLPTENNWMLDNTEGWIIQLAKDFEQTGDTAYLQHHVGRVKDGLLFLQNKIQEGLHIPVGTTIYDDYHHPPVYSYGASMYLACLNAAKAIAIALNDNEWRHQCDEQFVSARNEMIQLLWNGKWFSYGCQTDGSKHIDSIVFTGQLGGQFISRYCGWGDILPMNYIQAAIVAQFKTSLYHTPDYYANKVWNVTDGRGMDMPGSQCWPFYLESYTGLTALQAGYVDDAMDILRHIQLVHLRKGWTWCQNLWNHASLNYMTAPVTWFSTDVLAGAGINIPRHELRLAPVLLNKNGNNIFPLFYPKFWAILKMDAACKKATLTIIKFFCTNNEFINKIIIELIGQPSNQHKQINIPSFVLRKNNVLDLSNHWQELSEAHWQSAVLPNADATDFLEVKKQIEIK